MSADSLELIDLGFTAKLGLKGAGAADWLAARQLPVPQEIYGATRLAHGGWIVKIGAAEYFVEPDDPAAIEHWLAQGPLPPGVYRAPREETALLLQGDRTKLLALVAQTCAIEVAKAPPERIFYSRVAGVSCGILPATTSPASFRLWVDPTYADYLWETLAAIVAELGGQAQRSPPRRVPTIVPAH